MQAELKLRTKDEAMDGGSDIDEEDDELALGLRLRLATSGAEPTPDADSVGSGAWKEVKSSQPLNLHYVGPWIVTCLKKVRVPNRGTMQPQLWCLPGRKRCQHSFGSGVTLLYAESAFYDANELVNSVTLCVWTRSDLPRPA